MIQIRIWTTSIHSTIGKIKIEFNDPNMRMERLWKNQVSMSQEALQFYKEQVNEWLHQNIVEEMIDLES